MPPPPLQDCYNWTRRVDKIGLRFTILTNLYEQKVSVPNRTIGLISRYRRGYVRAYVDVQLPVGLSEEDLNAVVVPIMQGMQRQHPSIILAQPQSMGLRKTDPGNWQYVRYKFRLWPGQGALLETTLKKRIQTALADAAEGYQDWMIAITYRGE